MLNLDDLGMVVCRPALQKDTEQVMELSSHIWEGNDYLPYVWDEWMADPDGLLGVAEFKGCIAGVFKLTKFQEDEWYMEGLRVHPDFQGKGVASHIHQFVLETWRKMGCGMIRLTTASYNVKVHRMCEETGFKRIAEFIHYRAPVIDDGPSSFTQLVMDDAQNAFDFVMTSPSHRLSHGLINLAWVYANPQLKHVQEAIEKGHAWWWRDGAGFLSTWEDDDDGVFFPGIQLLGCRVEKLKDILLDYRREMGKIGYATADWVAPNEPDSIQAVQEAGFERVWEISLYIYELRE